MTAGPRSVLHVVWEYPPVIYGGLARHAEQLSRAQFEAGIDVGVLTAAEDVTDPQRRVDPGDSLRRGVRVRRIRRRAPRSPWSDLLACVAQLEESFDGAGGDLAAAADVVHAHDWIGSRAAISLAGKARIPVVLTVHATEWGRHQGRVDATLPDSDGVSAHVHRAERAGAAAADAVVVCSTAMRDEVIGVLAADPERVHVVPNAVDAAGWRCGRASVREARRYWLRIAETVQADSGPAVANPDDGPLVVAAGRLEWEKGFSTLIRAMPSLRRQFPGLRVVLAGRGSYAERLVELAQELGVLECLVLPGWLAGRDLAALYAASDAVVVPSRYEPSGLVAREAQAAGAVVVATDVGGLVDVVVHGRTGLRVGVGDVHGLHDALASLARDPVRAHALADAGRAAVRQLDWPAVAAATHDVYRTAAAARPR